MPNGRMNIAYVSPDIFRNSEDEVFKLGEKIVKTLPGKKFNVSVHPSIYTEGVCYWEAEIDVHRRKAA